MKNEPLETIRARLGIDSAVWKRYDDGGNGTGLAALHAALPARSGRNGAASSASGQMDGGLVRRFLGVPAETSDAVVNASIAKAGEESMGWQTVKTIKATLDENLVRAFLTLPEGTSVSAINEGMRILLDGDAASFAAIGL